MLREYLIGFQITKYAPWGGPNKYRSMSAKEIKIYLSEFKNHCKM
jgi:hypothetical protein